MRVIGQAALALVCAAWGARQADDEALALVARHVAPTLPVLLGEPWNPVARLELDVAADAGALELAGLSIRATDATTAGAIRAVAVFEGPAALDHRDPRATFRSGSELVGGVLDPEGSASLTLRESLSAGTTHLWLAVALDASAPDLLDGRVGLACDALDVVTAGASERVAVRDARDARSQRVGVALRTHRDDGAHAYRIPGLVTTNSGALLAVYDVRWHGWSDLPGDIDVAARRSVDGGRTWGAQTIVLDAPATTDGIDARGDGVGDPSVLVDRATGALFVLGLWSHGDRGWFGSGPGVAPGETGQLLLTRSDDDGVTWSAPRNLTPLVKDPSWCLFLQGPGRGITMSDGTLVFPAQYQASEDEGRLPFATILWSDDRGETWHAGTGARPDTTEAAVVELEDGVLMLNARDNRGGARSVFVSDDRGATWREHATSRVALIEPVCMASLLHVGRELGVADGRLLFSNPHVAAAPRRDMTIQASVDHGATWRVALLLDAGVSAGYSCLTRIDDDTIGILYEGSRAHLVFQRIALDDLFR